MAGKSHKNGSPPPVMNVTEAAKLLGVHRTTVIKLLQNGDLVGYKVTISLTGPWRVYRSSVEDYIELRERLSAPREQ